MHIIFLLTQTFHEVQTPRCKVIYSRIGVRIRRCQPEVSKPSLPLGSFQIPGFPVYTRAGELAVSVNPLTSDLEVTLEQLDQLRRFHSCIFAEVLRLEKPNLAFDPEKAEANYLVVPLDQGERGMTLSLCLSLSPLLPSWRGRSGSQSWGSN